MKKLALISLAAAAAFALPGYAAAQDGIITASATVSTVANITGENPVVFGDVAPGGTATVAYTAAASSGATAGTGYVAFETNAGYSVTVTTPGVLTNASAADDLTVTFTCGQSNSTGATATSTFTCGTGTSGSGPPAWKRWSSRLGGEVTVPGTAMAGTYTGDITVAMSNP